MHLKRSLGSPQMMESSLGKKAPLPSILSWSSNPTTVSKPLQTINVTQILTNPIPDQTGPLPPALTTFFFIFIISAFCVLMLLFFFIPRAVDYWEEWMDGRRNGDWRRRPRSGRGKRRGCARERRLLCCRAIGGRGARVLEYGGCGFGACKARCGILGCKKEWDVNVDLERADCLVRTGNGDKGGGGKGECEVKKCTNGKIVRFVEEVEVVEFLDKDIIMVVVGDGERKMTVGLKRGCEVS